MYAARRMRSGLGKPGPHFFELLRLIAGRMRHRFLVVEHRAEIAHIKPTAARFAFPKMLASLNGGPPDCLPMIDPRGIVGVMRAILVMLFPKDRSY
jgi:hypothetical protein